MGALQQTNGENITLDADSNVEVNDQSAEPTVESSAR